MNALAGRSVDDDRHLVLSNGLIETRVDLEQGADVVSLVDLATGAEVLWTRPAPAAGRTSGDDGVVAFYDSYRGGIQDLFPNAGPPSVIEGAALPFHGEARRTRWSVDPDDESVVQTRLARFPFVLRKRIRIDPDRPMLRVTTEATNEGVVSLPVHWGIHPAFGAALTEPGEVIGAFRGMVADAGPFGAARAHAPGETIPVATDGPTRLRLEDASAGTADLDYASCREGWYLVRNTRTGLTAIVTWPIELFRTLWVWQECRERAGFPWWGLHHIVGVEPHTSGPAQELAVDVAEGLSVSVRPGETLRAELTIELRILPESDIPGLVASLTSGTYDAEHRT